MRGTKQVEELQITTLANPGIQTNFLGRSGLSLGSRNDRFKCIHILKIDRFNYYSLSNFTGSIVHFPKIDRFNGTCWTCTNDSPAIAFNDGTITRGKVNEKSGQISETVLGFVTQIDMYLYLY